jgi:hypothetical protein
MSVAGQVASPRSPDLARVCADGLRFLDEVYSPERGLYPYSSRPLPGGGYASDYDNPAAVRYTVNTLLGLHAARRAGADELVDRFVERHERLRMSSGDRGLLLVLLAELGRHEGAARALLGSLDRTAREEPAARLNMQDLAWMIWGCSAAARAGLAGAEQAGHRLFELLAGEFVEPATGLPRHSLRRYRRHIVSFGSCAYFLRALDEHARSGGDVRAVQLFRRAAERILELQGPAGEWPWLLDARTGRILDAYPVFTVHQDSMAFLFLHSALERHGLSGAEEAAARSLAWAAGDNELGLPMFEHEPFCAFRSIERVERAPRLRRYLRAARPQSRPWDERPRVRLNPECRSYHVGWLLYVWAERVGAADA